VPADCRTARGRGAYRDASHGTKNGRGHSGLKDNVETLRAAQSQFEKDATALEDLKTRLDAVKTETGASIADLAGKIEQMQGEPPAILFKYRAARSY